MSTSVKTEGKCEVYLTEIDPFSWQSFTLGFISKQNLSALKLARMAYFLWLYVRNFIFFSVWQFSNSLDILSLIMVVA